MLDIQNITSSWFFEHLSLASWEYLFHEWDIDGRLYIVLQWELEIQKSIITQVWQFKSLGKIHSWDILWESALIETKAKEVSIQSTIDTEILFIDVAKNYKKFTLQYPLLSENILLYIIELNNQRLLQSNNEITTNYEISTVISQMKYINSRSVYTLLDTIEHVLWVEQIMFVEKNQALRDTYILKYDSLSEKKIKNTVLNIKSNQLTLDTLKQENIEMKVHTLLTPLILWDIYYGYIVISRSQKKFNENEEKILQNIATSLVGVIRQKGIQTEQKNIKSLRNSF